MIDIRDGSSTKLVYDYIKKEIMNQKLKRGSTLTQQVFCDILGAGHSPVRSALQALQQEGFVRIFRNKGAFVNEFSKQNIIQLCALRVELQTYGLRLCINWLTEKDFLILDTYIKDEIVAFKELDFSKYLAALTAFHRHIVDKAKNPYLSEAFLNVINCTSVYLALYDNFFKVDLPNSFENHGKIIQALRDKDIESAKQLLEEISNNMINVYDYS